MKIVYVVSTLKPTGPTNQLFLLAREMTRSGHSAAVVTLSNESSDSRRNEFEELGLDVTSLGLGRIQGSIGGRRRLLEIVEEKRPSVIHTQGWRADSFGPSLSTLAPWVATSRNFPPSDYPAKFGKILGHWMSYRHLQSQRRCANLVACSRSLQSLLKERGVSSRAIQNGVDVDITEVITNSWIKTLPRPITVSVGSLIERKNMGELVKAFSQGEHLGSLVILGGGPLLGELEHQSPPNVHMIGNVPDVRPYLNGCDLFVSSSRSEGLPNTVLEALSCGVPVVLSDIPQHQEIAQECAGCCLTYPLGDVSALAARLQEAQSTFGGKAREAAEHVARDVFSARRMAEAYQQLYRKVAAK